MYRGSCLCGAVTLELHGSIEAIIHCHCSRCRKSTGSAYATNGFIEKAALVIKTVRLSCEVLNLLPVKGGIFVRHVPRRFIVVTSKILQG